MRLIERLMWISAASCVPAFLAGIVLYLKGGLPLLIGLVNRPVSEPTAEEYAVYSVFIDDFCGRLRRPFRS